MGFCVGVGAAELAGCGWAACEEVDGAGCGVPVGERVCGMAVAGDVAEGFTGLEAWVSSRDFLGRMD